MAQSGGKVTYIHKRRKRSISVLGLGLFLLFCLSLSLYFFLNSAFFNVRKIEVSGCHTIANEQIIQLSGLVLGTNLMQIKASEAISKIELHPVVKSVRIHRRIPRTILIEVEERTPVALVVGTDSYLAVDSEGIYLRKGEDLLNELTLPVISGLTIAENISPGTDLTTEGLSAALELLEQMDEAFLRNVAEIKASSPYSLTFNMLQGVEVRFGEPEDVEHKLRLLQELLLDNGQVINDQTVEYIDLRYNSLPVIKRKNI